MNETQDIFQIAQPGKTIKVPLYAINSNKVVLNIRPLLIVLG